VVWQRGRGVEPEASLGALSRWVAEPVLNPFEVLGAQLAVGGDLLDRQALGSAHSCDARPAWAQSGEAPRLWPRGLGFDGRWFAV
jgi:hypothetical protein